MKEQELVLLKQLSAPYANGSAHVQGPGGNTSVKSGADLYIKASGFTFEDILHNTGIAVLDNSNVVKNLLSAVKDLQAQQESTLPTVLESVPLNSKPSMEFEFHAILDKVVLHTHSVYANVINCSTECETLLSSLFSKDEFVLVPYVTPGFPIASYLVNLGKKTIAPVIFLQNHGIIVHGSSVDEVISRYNNVQERIMNHFPLVGMPILKTTVGENTCIIDVSDIFGATDIKQMSNELTTQVLIPDQSIFFRNKVSDKAGAEIFLDKDKNKIVIKGTSKFIEAAKSMLQAVYYIRQSIATAGMKPAFISNDNIEILHGLSAEKYRTSIINSGK